MERKFVVDNESLNEGCEGSSPKTDGKKLAKISFKTKSGYKAPRSPIRQEGKPTEW